MFSVSSEAKVGLFVLVGLIILGYMSFQVGKRSFGMGKGYTLEVSFDNASGLERDASVQIAGVEVGRVESIRLREGRALVRLRIDPNVRLEKDAIAAIKTLGILGDKYIELYPGTRGSEYLPPGGQISQTESRPDLDKLLHQLGLIAEDVRGVTSALNRVLASQEGEEAVGNIVTNTRDLTRNLNQMILDNQAALRAAIENTRQLTGNLNRVVVQNDEKVSQVMDNLKAATSEMEKSFISLSEITGGINRGEGSLGQLVKDGTTAERLNKTLASLQEVSEKINEGRGSIGKLVNDDETAERLNKTLASLQEVSEKINDGRGSIGKLVNDDETVRNLNEGLKGLNRYMSKADQFRIFLSYRGEYLFGNSNAKSYLEARIQPNEDKFYLLGVVSDPRGRRMVRDVTVDGFTSRIEEWKHNGLLFSAQIGKRYHDLVLRGGLLESTGGFGVDYYALNDRLKFSFEAFDFARDRRAHLKAGTEFQLFKHLYLTGGWDDFISDQNNRSVYGGLAIRFEDDDLKYILSTVPIPR
ncbi:MAG: MCE family protein [Syntrophaceae bacterium]|nr:MCE family protein [Syntrophaceae bacterium]